MSIPADINTRINVLLGVDLQHDNLEMLLKAGITRPEIFDEGLAILKDLAKTGYTDEFSLSPIGDILQFGKAPLYVNDERGRLPKRANALLEVGTPGAIRIFVHHCFFKFGGDLPGIEAQAKILSNLADQKHPLRAQILGAIVESSPTTNSFEVREYIVSSCIQLALDQLIDMGIEASDDVVAQKQVIDALAQAAASHFNNLSIYRALYLIGTDLADKQVGKLINDRLENSFVEYTTDYKTCLGIIFDLKIPKAYQILTDAAVKNTTFSEMIVNQLQHKLGAEESAPYIDQIKTALAGQLAAVNVKKHSPVKIFDTAKGSGWIDHPLALSILAKCPVDKEITEDRVISSIESRYIKNPQLVMETLVDRGTLKSLSRSITLGIHYDEQKKENDYFGQEIAVKIIAALDHIKDDQKIWMYRAVAGLDAFSSDQVMKNSLTSLASHRTRAAYQAMYQMVTTGVFNSHWIDMKDKEAALLDLKGQPAYAEFAVDRIIDTPKKPTEATLYAIRQIANKSEGEKTLLKASNYFQGQNTKESLKQLGMLKYGSSIEFLVANDNPDAIPQLENTFHKAPLQVVDALLIRRENDLAKGMIDVQPHDDAITRTTLKLIDNGAVTDGIYKMIKKGKAEELAKIFTRVVKTGIMDENLIQTYNAAVGVVEAEAAAKAAEASFVSAYGHLMKYRIE